MGWRSRYLEHNRQAGMQDIRADGTMRDAWERETPRDSFPADDVTARGKDAPDNPEVGARLTNLSLRHVGERPEWFSFAPLALPTRIRQCREVFWHIQDAVAANRKRMIALVAPKGMGKTAFLAELYGMLERDRNGTLTLAPGRTAQRPFEAIRSILEQRFYISGEASAGHIREYVTGAVRALLGDEAGGVSEGLLAFWKIRGGGQDTSLADVDRIRRIAGPALRTLIDADMRRNPMVVILDDVEHLDRESVEMLASLFLGLGEARLGVIVTATSTDAVPGVLRGCADVDYVALAALSDRDLGTLVDSLLRKMSEKREKMIVPSDLCELIARRAYGSPARAIELTRRHFAPERMVLWNEAMEALRHESVPCEISQNLVRRFKDCSEAERLVLRFASQLNVPFTSATIEGILATWEGRAAFAGLDCAGILRGLRRKLFFENAGTPFGKNAPAYEFRHECERVLISGTVGQDMRRHVYRAAARWYSLNNPDGMFDEAIGDLWHSYGFLHESCRFYWHAVTTFGNVRFMQKCALLHKLLRDIPEENVSDVVWVSIEAARAAFRIGQVDEAFRLCHRACHLADGMSAFSQAAIGCVQIAAMLVELGSVRHVDRYVARAGVLLNRGANPSVRCGLYIVLARRALFMARPAQAARWIERASAVLPDGDWELAMALRLTTTEADAQGGRVGNALDCVRRLIDEAKEKRDAVWCARLYRTLGRIHADSDNILSALEAWNKALGFVQETHDEILHAKLLADISDGAIRREARKTARAAAEQCLGMAQQTHQKALIARCLSNLAYLQYADGAYDRALRTARKAHKSACSLRCPAIWAGTLATIAGILAEYDENGAQRAGRIYRRIVDVYEEHGLVMAEVRHLLFYASFLGRNGMDMPAVNAYRLAESICRRLGLDRFVERITACLDRISQQNDRK